MKTTTKRKPSKKRIAAPKTEYEKVNCNVWGGIKLTIEYFTIYAFIMMIWSKGEFANDMVKDFGFVIPRLIKIFSMLFE